MTNFVYDNVALPDDKIDASGTSSPVANPTRRWSANDINRTFQALKDIRSVVKLQWVSVLAYGAKGDGIADDTASVQAAIDATAGRTLYFPKGKYKVSSTLFILDRGHHWVGDCGVRNSINGTEISYTGTGPCIQIGTDNGHDWDTGDYDGPQDHVIEHLWIAHAAPDTALIAAGGATQVKLGAYGIWDWRSGGLTLRNVGLEHFEANFVGIQSDINTWDTVYSLYSKYGLYFGPRSDQNTVTNLYSFFCDRAVTVDRAGQLRLIAGQIVFCGHSTCGAVEVRQGSHGVFIDGFWFENSGNGYLGTDGLSFVSVGEVAGYGAGGSVQSAGGAPTTTSVQGCTVHNPHCYSVLAGSPSHKRYIVSVGKCNRLRLVCPNEYINSSIGNTDAFVGIPVGQAPTTTDTAIEISGISSAVASAEFFENLGGGPLAIGNGVAVYTSGASGTAIHDNVTLGTAVTSIHTIRGAVSFNTVGNGLGVGVQNSAAGQTADATGLRSRSDGSFDTTSGTRNAVAHLAQAIATRSAGASTLRNIALQCQAANGQDNRAIETTTGDVQLNTTSGTTVMNKSWRAASEIVPPQITTSQNDYAPTSITDAAALLVNASGAVDITGITTGVAGRFLWIYNTGAATITLKHENASSSAGNRFRGIANADVALTASTGRWLYYSPSLSRWVVMQ